MKAELKFYSDMLTSFLVLWILLFLVSCGKIRTDNKVAISGETYSYVIVKFQFLDEIKELCTDIYPEYDVPNERRRKKLISQCTLDKMSILNLDALDQFDKGICPSPSSIEEFNICEVINGSKGLQL
jgi:hypothetical protein